MNFKESLNYYGGRGEPFFFIVSYNKSEFEVIPLKNLPEDIRYVMQESLVYKEHSLVLRAKYMKFEQYESKFLRLREEILRGNTYLANLTVETELEGGCSLEEIYEKANAKFKLYYRDKFVCFSPERFCSIKGDSIYAYPMKGTIDADMPDAKRRILDDEKELAEHTMVVDLLRNDLSMVSTKVGVKRFRYCETIKAGEKNLIQVSSEISGSLQKNWERSMGDIITSVLQAGSITGTPKRKTIEILRDIEGYERGYFTGVFGVYDGESLESSVMIRYIEKRDDGSLVYKSGGGITAQSDVRLEYEEMCDKVYIP